MARTAGTRSATLCREGLFRAHDKHATVQLHLFFRTLGVRGKTLSITVGAQSSGRHSITFCEFIVHPLGPRRRERYVIFGSAIGAGMTFDVEDGARLRLTDLEDHA